MGLAGTGKSHALIALGHAAVEQGSRVPVRYVTAAELVENLYRGLADNSVGRAVETLLRHELIIYDEVGFAPLDSTDSHPLAVQGLRPVPAQLQHRSQPAWPAPAPQQRRRHRRRELPHARTPQPLRRPPVEAFPHHASWAPPAATSGDRNLPIDKAIAHLGVVGISTVAGETCRADERTGVTSRQRARPLGRRRRGLPSQRQWRPSPQGAVRPQRWRRPA